MGALNSSKAAPSRSSWSTHYKSQMNTSTTTSSNLASGTEETESSRFPKISKLSFGLLVAIAVVTVILYSTTIGDYFLGDDFVHLPWLLRASHDPSMVLKSFCTSWLDISYVQFYRPLISVSLFIDYLIWGGNAVGYHLTNLFYHLVSTVAVFLIVRNVNRALDHFIDQTSAGQNDNFRQFLRSDLSPLLSAAMFAVYAVHPETVVWIVGRTDGLCSMFVLLALWCYTQAQFLRSRKWTALTLTTLSLALVSKEMAIPTPALLFVYSFLFPASETVDKNVANVSVRSERTGLLSPVVTALRATVLYWLLLVAYFGLRRLALGTFVGGYDNSLFLAFPLSVILKMWVDYLSIFCVPANGELISPRSPLRYVWLVAISMSPVLALLLARWRPPIFRLLAFYCAWLLISFVPIFKAFFLNDTLQGGRLVYLASAPFSVLIVIGWALLMFAGKWQKSLALGVTSLLMAISSYFLWMNNAAWAEAGAQSKAIETALHALYKDEHSDPSYFFCGIPNDLHGAWLGINAFEGMTRQPRMMHTLQHASCMIVADRVTPFGFLRDDYSKLGNAIHIFRWDLDDKKFHPLVLPKDDKEAHQSWTRDEFKGANGKALNLIAASSNPSKSAHVDVDFTSKSLQCFNANALEIALTILSVPPNSTAQFVNLRYQNDVQYQFDEASQENQLITPFLGAQKVVFPMRENVNWWLGGNCRKLRLTFPPGWCARIDSIACDHGDREIPTFGFELPKTAVTIGTFVMTPEKRSVTLAYDVSRIPGATGAWLEMTRPNTPFESHNSSSKSLSTEKTTMLTGLVGKAKIDASMLHGAGIYQFRIRAVNAFGKPLGFSSDHLVVFAEKGI
jgi:hypothetical protein